MLAAIKNGKQLSTEEIRNVRKLVEKMIANLYMVPYTTTRNRNNNAVAEYIVEYISYLAANGKGRIQTCIYILATCKVCIDFKAVCTIDHCIRMVECWAFYYFTKLVLMLNII